MFRPFHFRTAKVARLGFRVTESLEADVEIQECTRSSVPLGVKHASTTCSPCHNCRPPGWWAESTVGALYTGGMGGAPQPSTRRIPNWGWPCFLVHEVPDLCWRVIEKWPLPGRGDD